MLFPVMSAKTIKILPLLLYFKGIMVDMVTNKKTTTGNDNNDFSNES